MISEDRLPLTTLLAHALVAFTIEFDNEFERRLLHRTTTGGDATPRSSPAPWLVSLVMWENCMRHLDQQGLSVAELARRARTSTNVDGMRRWGYITIDGRGRGRGALRSRQDALLRPTRAGCAAQEAWRPLDALIEERWRERFGAAETEQLRTSLSNIADRAARGLPDCLPSLRSGLFTRADRAGLPPATDAVAGLPLSSLLARALLSLALEYERGQQVSLAIAANPLRVLDDHGQRLRDVARLSGVSKEGLSMAVAVLEKAGLAVVEPDPGGSRFKQVRLTPSGCTAQAAYLRRLAEIEARWQQHAGAGALREALLRTTGDGARPALGLEPYPDGWRAALPRPATLPHFPMVLHRGGFPDGS